MTSPQIDDFCQSLSVMVHSMKKENPSSIILTGDFNGRSPHFWEDELIENYVGKSLVEISSLNSLSQLKNEPTHFPQDNVKTCIDHIYTDAPESLQMWE